MPAKRKTAKPDTTPEAEAVLEALRSNLTLLGELASRYQVNLQPERPANCPSISCPADVFTLLGPEMSELAQEQLRVLLLDTRNRVVGQRVIYQGNVQSSVVRPAEVLRPAVVDFVPSIIVVHNHPPATRRPAPRTSPSPATWPTPPSSWASTCWITWSLATTAASPASRNGASSPERL